MIERFVDIHFQSYFTNDKEELEKNPNAKPKNEVFKNKNVKLPSTSKLIIFILKIIQFPLENFLKNIKLLKKSCLKLKNKQLFFRKLVFLRNFSKGKWSK